MKKIIILSIAVLFVVSFALTPAMAGGKANFQGPGYYQKIHGSNAGEIKFFKGKGHPSDSSEWVFLGGDDPDCGTCTGQNFFNGTADQYTGVTIERGNLKFDKNNMYKKGSGTIGYATEEAAASYYGHGDGQGLALAIGGSLLISDKFEYSLLGFDGKGYYVAGATGNISAAAVGNLFGEQPIGCAEISGSGEMGTLAARQSKTATALAASNGSFNYEGVTSNGIVIGGGITAGGSAVGAGNNNAWAVSGQVTASGVGNIGCGPSCHNAGYDFD